MKIMAKSGSARLVEVTEEVETPTPRKKLSKEAQSKLWLEVEKARKATREAEAAAERAKAAEYEVAARVYESMGKGPFRYKGEVYKLRKRGEITFFTNPESEDIETIG